MAANARNILLQSSVASASEDEMVLLGPDETRLHRMVAALLVEGKTPDVIAVTLNIDAEKVKALLRQKHTQDAVNEIAKTNENTDTVAQILAASEIDTVFKLLQLRDHGKTDVIKLNAVSQLLKLRNGNEPLRPKANKFEGHGDIETQVANLDRQIEGLKPTI
mgnify:CR=1 FL=1|tara:strand:+ start:227 stop:715 length:489 start_codon:yes stop_codon:yes gene_type:complete